MTPDLYRQNLTVLMVLQAIQGALTSNLKALSLEFQEDKVIGYLLLRRRSPQDEDEILNNTPTEVSVLTNGVADLGEVLLEPEIVFVDDRPAGYVLPGRPVLLFRD